MAKKIRLTKAMRYQLRSMIHPKLMDKAEEKAWQKAYSVCLRLLHREVVKQFPTSDMMVLRKYNVAQGYERICVRTGAGRYDQFNVIERKDDFFLPLNHWNSRFSITGAVAEAFEHYQSLSAARNKKIEQIASDLGKLVNNAVYLEDIEAVWPKAREIRPSIQATLPTVLLGDVIERLNAAREAGAI